MSSEVQPRARLKRMMLYARCGELLDDPDHFNTPTPEDRCASKPRKGDAAGRSQATSLYELDGDPLRDRARWALEAN